jgi:hypothetical protein
MPLSAALRFFAVACALLAGAQAAHGAEAVRVLSVSGLSIVQRSGETPRVLGIGDSLTERDTISVGPESHATLEFADRTRVVLRPNTVFRIDAYRESAPESMLFGLLKGGLRALTGLLAKRNPGAVRFVTATATVGIRGTEFDARLCEDDCEAEARSVPAPRPDRKDIARVVEMSGIAAAAPARGPGRLLAQGSFIYQHEGIATGGRSYVVLAFRDGSRITLDERSRLAIPRFEYDATKKESGRAYLRLAAGSAHVWTGEIAKLGPDAYLFHSNLGVIRPRGTGFSVGGCVGDACVSVSGSADESGVSGSASASAGNTSASAAGSADAGGVSGEANVGSGDSSASASGAASQQSATGQASVRSGGYSASATGSYNTETGGSVAGSVTSGGLSASGTASTSEYGSSVSGGATYTGSGGTASVSGSAGAGGATASGSGTSASGVSVSGSGSYDTQSGVGAVSGSGSSAGLSASGTVTGGTASGTPYVSGASGSASYRGQEGTGSISASSGPSGTSVSGSGTSTSGVSVSGSYDSQSGTGTISGSVSSGGLQASGSATGGTASGTPYVSSASGGATYSGSAGTASVSGSGDGRGATVSGSGNTSHASASGSYDSQTGQATASGSVVVETAGASGSVSGSTAGGTPSVSSASGTATYGGKEGSGTVSGSADTRGASVSGSGTVGGTTVGGGVSTADVEQDVQRTVAAARDSAQQIGQLVGEVGDAAAGAAESVDASTRQAFENWLGDVKDATTDTAGKVRNKLESGATAWIVGAVRDVAGPAVEHLENGLGKWLAGTVPEPGVTPPRDYGAGSIVEFIGGVLGISKERVYDIVERKLGQPGVDALRAIERGADKGKEGPAAMWVSIREDMQRSKEALVSSALVVWSGAVDVVRNAQTTAVSEGRLLAAGANRPLPVATTRTVSRGAPRPDLVRVDPKLFNPESARIERGLYVWVREGAVQLEREGRAIEVGAGGAAVATAERIALLDAVPGFMRFDPTPRPQPAGAAQVLPAFLSSDGSIGSCRPQ